MTKVKVVEALCGCGKSYWMIEEMKRRSDKKWIWVTPFLDEAGDDDTNKTGRVREQAPELNFQTPSAKNGSKNKLDDLLRLITDKHNISMTHNLFLMMTAEIVGLIEEQGYSVVIDETIEKVELLDAGDDLKEDIKVMIADKVIEVEDDGKLSWVGIRLNAYKDQIELCDSGILYLHKDRLLIKRYSSKLYEVAKEVYILTYMFKASPMCVWLEINGVKWKYIEPDLRITSKERKKQIRELIHIEKEESDLKKYCNKRGTEFSSSWYKKANEDTFESLRTVSDRLYKRWYYRLSGKGNIMYTTFKDYRDKVAGTGTRRITFTESESSFVTKNARATNDFANKDCLLYWVNVYPHQSIKEYLDYLTDGNGVNSDEYALSEMIQWVFRSALRNGEPISIFIASNRMKNLFAEWLKRDY